MDTEKLFISDGAIEKLGYAYFVDVEYDDYNSIANWNETVELEDGLFLERDDMDNYNIRTDDEDDCSFEDIEELRNKIQLDYYSSFFNMKAICEKANVNYTTYRSWKQKGLSERKIISLLKEMKNITNDIQIAE